MKLLITSIGKRVQLLRHLKTNFYIIGADASPMNPARAFTDEFFLIPRCDEPGYIEAILSLCQKNKISMLIPLYEKEFSLLNAHRNEIEAAGTILLLSKQPVIETCNNKIMTARFFKEMKLPAPLSYTGRPLEEIVLPVIIKPLDGMGSSGVFSAFTKKELEFFSSYVKNPVIEQRIEGTEYTIDILCDLKGAPLSIIPRERIEVRSGEVSKSRTVKNNQLIQAAAELIQALNKLDTVIGPITVQCFLTKQKELFFIEINPRFGGGVPLSFAAGVSYSCFLKKMIEKKPLKSQIGQFKELCMLRYDEAVYIEEAFPDKS